jgi:hypothetical protein
VPTSITAETELRQRVAGELQADEDRGDRVGEDQYAVLRDLRIGDALHATEHGVEEHDAMPTYRPVS